jgi:hypothetical protein
MGWRRKRPERQPHLALEQGKDNTRARRKTGGRREQEVRCRGRKAGWPCSGTMEMPTGECPDAGGGAAEHGHAVVVIFA